VTDGILVTVKPNGVIELVAYWLTVVSVDRLGVSSVLCVLRSLWCRAVIRRDMWAGGSANPQDMRR